VHHEQSQLNTGTVNQWRCHGFEGGGGQFREQSERKNFESPPPFAYLGDIKQNIAHVSLL